MIEKGELWEKPFDALGVEVTQFDSDAALARKALELHSAGECLYAKISNTDFARSLGARNTSDQKDSEQPCRLQLSVDLGVVTTENSSCPFISHAIAKRLLWSGKFAVAMNSGWKGSLYLGSRSHPNDGRIDVTSGSLSFRERVQARKRAETGTHIPHPSLRYERCRSWETNFSYPIKIFCDGQLFIRSTFFKVEVIPDAFVLVV